MPDDYQEPAFLLELFCQCGTIDKKIGRAIARPIS